MKNFNERLEAEISKVCPIPVGSALVIGKRDDRSTWRFTPFPEATPQQIAAGQAVIDAFDDSDAAQSAWEEDQKPERKTLRQQAATAISEIDAFLALPAPTAAQVRDQVQDICRYLRVVIRRLAQID